MQWIKSSEKLEGSGIENIYDIGKINYYGENSDINVLLLSMM